MELTIPLSKAKDTLSALGHDASMRGVTYTVTVRDVPLFVIAPLPESKKKKPSCFGMLSEYANANAREHEDGLLAAHAEVRYADAS